MESFRCGVRFQKLRSALCHFATAYSPCGNTPTTATVAVTTGEVSLLISKKKIFFVSLHPFVVHSRSDTPFLAINDVTGFFKLIA
jgi:hypothetical protein